MTVGYVLEQPMVIVTNDGVSSNMTPCTVYPGGDGLTVSSSPTITVNGESFRWFPAPNGGLHKKNADGTWSRVGRMKNSKKNTDFNATVDTPPPHGWAGPGEDISSLPDPVRP